MITSKYKIIQAPMAGGIITPAFVSSVSNFGMVGSIPSGYLALEDVEQFIKSVKSKTSKPFILNIFVDYNNYEKNYIKKPKEIIQMEKMCGIYNNDYFFIPKQPKVNDLINLAIKYKIEFISTTFGLLHKKEVALLKTNSINILTTVNNIKEAKIALKTQSPTGIIFQSKGAGGHKGGFLDNNHYSDESSIKTFIEKNRNIYFIKSGDNVNKDDIELSFKMGYDFVQIGTGFLMTKESNATNLHKQAILNTKNNNQLRFTNNITGKMARGVKNALFDLQNEEKMKYPFLHYATSNLRRHAKNKNLKEYQSFWAGNSALKVDSIIELEKYMESLI